MYHSPTLALVALTGLFVLAPTAQAGIFSSPFYSAPAVQPQAQPQTQEKSGRFAFKSKVPLSSVRLKASRGPQVQLFAPSDFYQDVEARCIRTINGNMYPWLAPDVRPLNPLMYATEAVAQEIATALGGTVSEATIIPYPCTINRPQLEVVFTDDRGNSVRLNAGLIANTFNIDPEWLALLRIRSEIAHGFYLRVPSWEETANELNCGRAVLGITLELGPEFQNTCRK